MIKSFRHVLVLSIMMGMGVSLSMLASFWVYRWEISQQQNRFQQRIDNLAIALQRSLNRYTNVLTFLGDYYAVTQDRVQRQEFANFVARSLATYPGIKALEWAPVVQNHQRVTYERAIRAEGYPTFQITELTDNYRLIPAKNRPYYIPVTYIAPFVGNEVALGFDLNSSNARVAAIEPSRETGKVQATGRIRLVQEQRDQYGFLMVLPLYQTAEVPIEIAARQTQFEGVLLGVFRISDVVEESLQGLSYAVNFTLYDLDAPSDKQFLGRYYADKRTVMATENRSLRRVRQPQSLCPKPTHCTRTLEIGQRQWLIDFLPWENRPFRIGYRTLIVLLTGLFLTGSLVLFLHNLQRELSRTKALNDLKQRFFSIASHELRTPLSTILLSTESLQANHHQLSEVQKQTNIQRIHRTARQMSQQITDLLTLARAEAGKLEFHPELLDVAIFCQTVIDEVQGGISQSIVFTSSNSAPKAFWDKKLVRSLLSNLLSNAAKYSPKDTTIEVMLSSNVYTATFEIRDRGKGIPVSELAHVREAFQRGSNVGNIAGTGLGLTIVKVCVDLHRGEWHIKSIEGRGTTVIVSLPLE
ncbi:CHASE domain-containing protein [Myxosarcina sp. GI1]|uniref:CHASE domain-containing sensor histidine kinase n=1 Tax=Myxosarcina sp. GI1 TaxID=1541065 RepID=UPI00056B52DF|nr:CHASE domain-containing protein [Myxosarcina sp. GI1]